MENKLHELKIYKHYFDAILDGRKKFEIRKMIEDSRSETMSC